MGKILGSWIGMRKYPEQEMIVNSLRGRIRYACTSYAGMGNCNQNIQDSIRSQNPLIRMFAVLDKRVRKRTPEKLKREIDAEPKWLRQIYSFRFSVEWPNGD